MTDADRTEADVIDLLAGLTPGSPLALIRARKPITRDQAQASHDALFAPADAGDVTLRERFALATFCAELHGQDDIAAFYARGLDDTSLTAALQAEASTASTAGPYGAYPKGPLSVEDQPGISYHPRSAFDPKLAAALAHVHMLVFHPRDASPAHLQSLLDAGWSNTAIVTISQLVAFLSFQIRTIAGLRILAGATP